MISKRKIGWLLGLPLILLFAAGVGFYERPISYFNAFSRLRLWLQGSESHYLAVAGHRIHYNALGPAAGPVVVLVHGLGGRAEDWVQLAPFLSKAGYRVYMPDLPGFGRSEKPAEMNYSIEEEATSLLGFMDAMGLRQVDLGGWSMGGWIVQRVAGEHPERIRRLMLFDSAGLRAVPTWDTRLFTPTSPAELDQLDTLLMPQPPRVPGFIARDILRISRENAWVVHRALDRMLTGEEATDSLLPGLRMPVLIVWGSEDRIMPIGQAEQIQRLVPQSQLQVFPGCGHLAPGQCAAEIGPRVVTYLKQ